MYMSNDEPMGRPERDKSLRGCGCRQKERVGVQTKRTKRWAPVVTTKRRLRWVQPPRLGVRRASLAAPRVLVLLRSHSERGSEVRGRRNCITTNYDKLYTMYLVYYVCATRSETYPMPSLGSEWSSVRVPSPRWSRCRFQSNRNRSVTAGRRFKEILELSPFHSLGEDRQLGFIYELQ